MSFGGNGLHNIINININHANVTLISFQVLLDPLWMIIWMLILLFIVINRLHINMDSI